MSTEAVATNGKTNGRGHKQAVKKALKKAAGKKLSKAQKQANVELYASLQKKADLDNFIITINRLQHSEASTSSREYGVKFVLANPEDRAPVAEQKVRVCLWDAPLKWIRALKSLATLDEDTGEVLKSFMAQDNSKQLEKLVKNPTEFRRALGAAVNKPEPILEFKVNGIWYPVPLRVSDGSFFFSSFARLDMNLMFEDQLYDRRWYVSDAFFTDVNGQPRSRTVMDVMQELGFRTSSKENIKSFKEKLRNAETFGEKHGTVVDVTKSVILFKQVGWWTVMEPVNLGTPESPRTLILERHLERTDDENSRQEAYVLPVLRVFSPDLKKFCYIDIDDVAPHVFDDKAKDRIVLPSDMKDVLDSVFECKPGQIFGDLFRNRHGGLIILASGGPGVGKTLTAEVYSEYTHRPLYIMEMGELGTRLESVEQNLQRIFDRAQRWNAVLLFDEADIFLAKRTDSDLDRSAIVGVFLRLLDRYDGCLFLTTNRPEVIDPAFKSRISLALKYPDLEADRRRRVFDQMLAAAGLSVEGDMTDIHAEDLNGRNIRNIIRILKMLNKDRTILTPEDVNKALEYIAR